MKPILFNQPYRSFKENILIEDAIKRNQYSNGYYTNKCQSFIEKKLELNKVLLTDSCTSALEISALLLRKFNTSQEVILPSYTFPSTASAFLKIGFKIIFADIDPKTFMIDIRDVKLKITDQTAAIVVVHYGSHHADLHKFKKLCKQNSIFLVEDAAQGFNSFLGKKSIGSFGDLSCFSFHETKNIQAGLCGALSINNKKFIERAEYIWERGTNRKQVIEGVVDKYQWVEIGGSYYPTEFQAAFLFSQLKNLNKNLKQRKHIYKLYFNGLESLKKKDIIYFPVFKKNFRSNYHSFWILLVKEINNKLLINFLKKYNVFAYIGYVPLHNSKLGNEFGFDKFKLKNTEKYSQKIIRLPFHNFLKTNEVKKVCYLINKYLT